MNTAATATIGHTYGHTGHIPTVCVAVVVAICATPATFVVVVAGVATASAWDLRSSIFHRVFAASPVNAVSLAAKIYPLLTRRKRTEAFPAPQPDEHNCVLR